ncbi:MAG: pentapeptide repeat-containing protein [Methanotrichaceae archaeon]|nr:pentapeptide repeat-containing protein [Methanotrichaceae archaeon]
MSHRVVSWQTVMLLVLLTVALWLPVKADGEQVGAGEILSRVQTGRPVACDCVEITGDLNLSGLGVNGTFSITNSTIHGANFLGTSFADFVDFEGTVFDKSADFSAAQFFKSTSFKDVRFPDDASFFLAQFLDDSSFSNATFKNVSFIDASLSHTLFNQARFEGRADFNFTSFGGYCGFWNASLENASFLECQFKGNADFSNSSFGQVNFINARFDQYSNFDGTSFQGSAVFAGANFQDQGQLRFISLFPGGQLPPVPVRCRCLFRIGRLFRRCCLRPGRVRGTGPARRLSIRRRLEPCRGAASQHQAGKRNFRGGLQDRSPRRRVLPAGSSLEDALRPSAVRRSGLYRPGQELPGAGVVRRRQRLLLPVPPDNSGQRATGMDQDRRRRCLDILRLRGEACLYGPALHCGHSLLRPALRIRAGNRQGGREGNFRPGECRT